MLDRRESVTKEVSWLCTHELNAIVTEVDLGGMQEEVKKVFLP